MIIQKYEKGEQKEDSTSLGSVASQTVALHSLTVSTTGN